MIFRWLIGIALLFAILLLLLPNKGEHSEARIASASMLACTLNFRDRVGQQLVRNEVPTARFENKCQNAIAAVEVSQRGEIVITGTQHQLKLTLSPVVDRGQVRWSCRGEPAAAVTKLCKP
jgi:hypothetical protein